MKRALDLFVCLFVFLEFQGKAMPYSAELTLLASSSSSRVPSSFASSASWWGRTDPWAWTWLAPRAPSSRANGRRPGSSTPSPPTRSVSHNNRSPFSRPRRTKPKTWKQKKTDDTGQFRQLGRERHAESLGPSVDGRYKYNKKINRKWGWS